MSRRTRRGSSRSSGIDCGGRCFSMGFVQKLEVTSLDGWQLLHTKTLDSALPASQALIEQQAFQLDYEAQPAESSSKILQQLLVLE